MPIFENGNIKTYYELHGSGPALLMIAGMASDSKSWQFILNDLEKHYRVILFDNRGCGRTLTDNQPFDIILHAALCSESDQSFRGEFCSIADQINQDLFDLFLVRIYMGQIL